MRQLALAIACSAAGLWAVAEGADVLGASWAGGQITSGVRELRRLAQGRLPRSKMSRARGVASAVAFFGCELTIGTRAGVMAALVASLGVGRANRWRTAARHRALERALPAALRSLADGVSAGLGIAESASGVARAADNPAGECLGLFARDLRRGAGMEQSLTRLVESAGSEHMDALATAVELHRRAGGDLPGSIVAIAVAVEDLEREAAAARSATAQAKFTAKLIAGLLALAVLGVVVGAPGFVSSVVSSPVSCAMVVGALGLQLTGFVLIRRLGLAAIR